MHQTCSLKRILPSSVLQLYCIVPERRFRAACQPETGRFVRGLTSLAESNRDRSGPDSLPESNSAVVNPKLHVWCFRVALPGPLLRGGTPGADRKIDAPDEEVQAY